jgi:hypothetical protein
MTDKVDGISRLLGTLSVSDKSSVKPRKSGKFTIFFVDNKTSLRDMLADLGPNDKNSDFSLAVDLEGVNLGATGEICIIQLISSQNPTHIYLLDICSLGSRAFTAEIQADDQVVSSSFVLLC